MAAVTSAQWDPALKQLYRDSNVYKSTYKRRPMFGSLPKFEGFTGRNMPLVNVFGNPQGRSADFTSAQAGSMATQMEDFLLDIVSDYSIAQVSGDAIDRTRSDDGAFLKALKKSIDFAMDSLADAIESFIPRSGTGSIGQVSSGSTVSTASITLADINDAANFEVGMTLAASQNDGGALATGSSTGEVLKAINRTTGVLTSTSAAWTTVVSGIAASYYLYVKGDAQNNGSARTKLTGFAAWLPSSAPASNDSFWSVNRSVDSRLYGTYHDGSAQTVEEALIDAQSKAAQQEGVPDLGFINHVKMRRLVKELGAKREYCTVNATSPTGTIATVGYEGVYIQGDLGRIKMVAANKCPSTDAYMLEQEQWMLYSIGRATKFIDDDNNQILRQGSADGVEVRLVSRANVACKNPIGSARVAMP